MGEASRQAALGCRLLRPALGARQGASMSSRVRATRAGGTRMAHHVAQCVRSWQAECGAQGMGAGKQHHGPVATHTTGLKHTPTGCEANCLWLVRPRTENGAVAGHDKHETITNRIQGLLHAEWERAQTREEKGQSSAYAWSAVGRTFCGRVGSAGVREERRTANSVSQSYTWRQQYHNVRDHRWSCPKLSGALGRARI